MAHHASDFSDEIKKATNCLMLGATGNFPRGKIDRLDEGEIKFAVAADHKTKTVLLNFGKPIVWVGMTADQAIDVSNSLRDKAIELKTNSKY